MRSPKLALAVVVCTAALVAGTSGRFSASATVTAHPSPSPTQADCLKLVKPLVHTKGKLTVATDNPVYPPWFVSNTPSNGKGYESAVAYHIASTLGFKHSAVTWYTEPYATALLAGPKPFDFDINEITYAASLTSAVSFSDSYFNLNESLVALKGTKITTHHTPAQLRTFLYGAQSGSVSLSFVKKQIRPAHPPVAFKNVAAAVAALQAKHVAAIVVDTPSGQYIAAQQLVGGVQVGQFKTTSPHYSLLLRKDNPLLACVNTALRVLSRHGTLNALSKKYLTVFNAVPILKP